MGDISIIVRIIVILIIFTILGLLAFYFIHKHGPNIQSSSVPSQVKTNISKGGVFFVGPDYGKGEPLIYRSITNVYYDAGICTDCPTACETATKIQNIIRADCTVDGLCKPVIVSSARDITNSYLASAKGNKMTQMDCSVIIDTSNDPTASYANQQAISLIEQAATKPWVSLWDFIRENRDQIITMGAQVGIQIILSKIIGEYAIVVMCLPGLLGSDANARYASGVMIGVFGGKEFLFQSLPAILKRMSGPIREVLVKAGDTVVDVAVQASTEFAAKAAAEAAARATASILEAMTGLLNPAFVIFDLLMITGIILDMVDPCGYNNTLSQDDINASQQAFDSVIFTSMLKAVGHAPVEWYAESIQEYNLICPSSTTDTKIIGKISRTDKEYLTRNENIFGGTGNECEDAEIPLRLAYTKQYQDSLTVNSLGQCVRNLTSAELDAKLSAIMGVPVTMPTGKDITNSGVFDSFQHVIDYVSLQVADNNVIVANFLSTYWYVVIILLIIILLIAFFL